MSTRVRFAPSPTGYLHIGGLRTAAYNYLLAKHYQGQFVLRIEDTDFERSKKGYEELQVDDLKWCGVEYDEGPNKEGSVGPYRQSERVALYEEHAMELVRKELAFYDFCSDEELEAMKEANLKNGTAAYTGKWRKPEHYAEALAKVETGERASIRFKVSSDKSYQFKDLVRGEVAFPENMVGDFVIMRSNGLPTYNFCNVIDDHAHKISHVLRGEEHLNNTLRQLMIYEAFSWEAPKFAHLSIMIGEDRQKLSKRHGATSVRLYREMGFLPQALVNYLCLLGWSHPEEKSIFTLEEIIGVFDENRFNKSPAMYDIDKLKWTNEQHLRLLSEDELLNHARSSLPKDGVFNSKDEDWQRKCLQLFLTKIQVITEVEDALELYLLSETAAQDEVTQEFLQAPETLKIAQYISKELENFQRDNVNEESFTQWMDHCKKELGIKGKPLFMGLRVALTGSAQGPDLKPLVSLIPINKIKSRIQTIGN